MTSRPPREYVAPARYVLGQLHRPDPDVPPGETDGEPTTGRTLCGQPMKTSDLWQPVPYQPGDMICRGCNGTWVTVPVQGALL